MEVHPRLGRLPRLALTGGGILAGVAVGILAFAIGAEAPPTPDAGALLEARARVLRARVDLAADERLYLLLEPDRSSLTLYQGGATLRTWTVTSIEAGERRVPVGRGQARAGWRSALWEDGRMDPPVERERRVIVSDQVEPPDLTGAVDWVPPTPEEEVPTPSRFVVHFGDGLGLEVRAPGTDTLPHRPTYVSRMRAAAGGLRPANWDRYRILVEMTPGDAGALYRTLPPGVAFLAVLPER